MVISSYQPVILNLDLRLRIKKKEFNPELVEQKVRQAIIESLALERRNLGQSLHISDIYKLVEAVKGVENSVCSITGVSFPEQHVVDAHYLPAKQREVIYVDESLPADIRSQIDVKIDEYTL